MNNNMVPKLILFLAVACTLTVSAQDSRTSEVNKNLVLIPGGSFIMGSPESEDWREADELQHEVSVDSFTIGRFEVTQSEYESAMGKNPSSFKGKNLPVESVSWYDAIEFCNALSRQNNLQPVYTIDGKAVRWNRDANGYRLPTEAEWEYACRAGTITPFNTGGNISVDDSNYFGTYPYTIEDNYWSQNEMDTSPGVYREKTVPVNQFEPNKYGLYNMHGNVSEWCWDAYSEYNINDSDNPSGPASGFMRVCRGGGWNDFGKHLRSAYRSAIPADDIFFSRGFRVARNSFTDK